MIGANVNFTLDGVPLSIQCNENDVMKDICQKYANKIQRNINTLVFLYGGNELNLNLKFKDVIIVKGSKEMKILVYLKIIDDFICPKCGEKINLNTEYIESEIAKRAEAKKQKDFSSADSIRAKLEEQGIILNDTVSGTTWDIKALY